MSSKRLKNYWREYAANELKVVRLLFAEGESRGFAYQAAVFHCHQAVEKLLKALLVESGIIPPRIHDLPALLSKLKIEAPDIQQAVEEINPHYLYPRYPDIKFLPSFHFSYNKRNTAQILKITERVCRRLNKQFKKL